MLFTSVLSPILLLLLWRGAAGRPRPGFLVFLAAFSGLGALGGNAFALERRGLLLLFSFPVDRFADPRGQEPGRHGPAASEPASRWLGVAALLAEPGLLLAAPGHRLHHAGHGRGHRQLPLHPLPGARARARPQSLTPPCREAGASRPAFVTGLLMFAALVLASPFMFLAFLPVLLGDCRLLLVADPPRAGRGAGASTSCWSR